MGLMQMLRGTPDSRPRVFQGLEVRESVDARGFPQVFVTDRVRRQIATPSVVDASGTVGEATAAAWMRRVCGLERMRAAYVCDGTTSAPVSLGGIFAASGRAERRDLSELESMLAVEAPALYDAGVAVGLAARPAREVELAGRCGHLLGAAVRSVDDIAALEWEQDGRSVKVGAVELSAFTLSCADTDSAAEASADLSDVMAEWDAAGHIWRTRWMRPFVTPGALASAETGQGGRVWSTVTVAGGPDVDELFLQALTPRTRLRVRREYGRQAVMVTATLGLGVTGFQHTVIDAELPG